MFEISHTPNAVTDPVNTINLGSLATRNICAIGTNTMLHKDTEWKMLTTMAMSAITPSDWIFYKQDISENLTSFGFKNRIRSKYKQMGSCMMDNVISYRAMLRNRLGFLSSNCWNHKDGMTGALRPGRYTAIRALWRILCLYRCYYQEL